MTLECYSRPGTRFRAMGPFYSSYGHRGQDFYVSAGSAVRAYEDMVIEVVGQSGGLGTVVGARLASDGRHAGWAHLRNVQSFTNGWVPAGTKFAEVAGAGDNPGTLWDGAHIHTTLTAPGSSSFDAAYGNAPLEDPLPRIQRSGAQATNARPAPARPKPLTLFERFRKDHTVGETITFIRQQSPGQPGHGGIFLLNWTQKTKTGLTGGGWQSFDVLGYKYTDLSPAEFAATHAPFKQVG